MKSDSCNEWPSEEVEKISLGEKEARSQFSLEFVEILFTTPSDLKNLSRRSDAKPIFLLWSSIL